MATIVHQGVKLAYEDRGVGKPAHGVRAWVDVQSIVLRSAG
jgi:hypothetical protein